MTLNLFDRPTTTNTTPKTKATTTKYHRTGIYPRTMRGEVDYVCSACLAIVPDGVTCRHCKRKSDQRKQRLEEFLAAKKEETDTHGVLPTGTMEACQAETASGPTLYGEPPRCGHDAGLGELASSES